MLSPPDLKPEKHWGKLYQLSFFPVPWSLEWFKIISLKDMKYDLIWSNNGNMRSIISMRSQPISLTYKGVPFFLNPSEITIDCYLYRVIHTYPEANYYFEDVFVLSKNEALSLSFRPYFESELCMTNFYNTKTARSEEIPDYFAIWNSNSGISRGYGFAADGHVRRFELSTNDKGSTIVRWRLPHSHHNRCINYFMFHGYNSDSYDPYYEIGHHAWYEKVFKPLDVYPYKQFSVAKRYIPL